jgi:hypothetical protein
LNKASKRGAGHVLLESGAGNTPCQIEIEVSEHRHTAIRADITEFVFFFIETTAHVPTAGHGKEMSGAMWRGYGHWSSKLSEPNPRPPLLLNPRLCCYYKH